MSLARHNILHSEKRVPIWYPKGYYLTVHNMGSLRVLFQYPNAPGVLFHKLGLTKLGQKKARQAFSAKRLGTFNTVLTKMYTRYEFLSLFDTFAPPFSFNFVHLFILFYFLWCLWWYRKDALTYQGSKRQIIRLSGISKNCGG